MALKIACCNILLPQVLTLAQSGARPEVKAHTWLILTDTTKPFLHPKRNLFEFVKQASFDAAQNCTGLYRPQNHRWVVTSCEKPMSIRTQNHCVYDQFVSKFAVAFLVFKPVEHAELPVSLSEEVLERWHTIYYTLTIVKLFLYLWTASL